MNLLQVLHQYGQSIWLDGFERDWISRGHLKRYIEENGFRGVRLNFQSLQAAIEGQAYDRDFTALAQQGRSRTAQSDYDYLIMRDLQLAADLLKPVHSQTHGRDGFVQIDLPPTALFEAETAIAAAQKIWQSVGWSNLLLRIPATPLMLPVIEQLISDRINVNATSVFSPKVYEQIFNRYLMGLERLIQRGESVSDVVCFASVSMGHLNVVINSLIANLETSFSVVQTKILYQHYHQFHASVGEAFPLEIGRRSLPAGAKPLRLVWDCTDISPESAWCYLQIRVAPETVILLSPSTLELYREISLLPTSWADERVEQIPISGLQIEISLDKRVEQFLNEEGVRSLNAFHQLLDTIEQKRMR